MPGSHKDIKKLAGYLKGTKFRASYVSPLQRTLTTAVMLRNDMGIAVPVVVDDRLKELNLGNPEGIKFVDAESQCPGQIKTFRYSPERYDPLAFYDKNFKHMTGRGKSLISDIVKCYPSRDDRVLLMNHGTALCASIRALEGYDITNIRKRDSLTSTSLTIPDAEDQGKTFSETAWNETSYLSRKTTSRDTI